MAQLRQDYDEFRQREAEIIAVGPESAEDFPRYWQQEGFPFVGIPDPEHDIADLYGQEVKLLKLGRLPALMVIDRDGQVRYSHHGNNMQDIPDDAVILALLDELNAERNDTPG